MLYTAKLEAVHAESDTGISAAMLRKACQTTRPSTSPADRARFVEIFSKFRNSGKPEKNRLREPETEETEEDLVASENPETLLGNLGNFGYRVTEKRLATA